MPDVPDFPDDHAVDEYQASQRIGAKVLEMADRLKVAHAVCPGAVATWGFTIDGIRYTVQMRVASPEVEGS